MPSTQSSQLSADPETASYSLYPVWIPHNQIYEYGRKLNERDEDNVVIIQEKDKVINVKGKKEIKKLTLFSNSLQSL